MGFKRGFARFFTLVLCATTLLVTVKANTVQSTAFSKEDTFTFMRAVEYEGDIAALSAILVDLDSGAVLAEKDADKALPPASVTKVMTMLLVIEAAEAGKISFDDSVAASEHASKMGGSQIYLKAGEVMTVDELFKAVSIASANDAAVALAEYVAGSEAVFVSLMNAKARELGMENTVFKNACGLHEDGHVTSARDIALMTAEIVKHEEAFRYTLTWMDSVRNGEFGLVNTNKLIRSYRGITGLKTGSTDAAKFCMSATASRDGLNLCAVVMGCATAAVRFETAAALLDFGFANYERVSLAGDYALPEIKVRFGETEVLTPVFEGSAGGVIPRGRGDDLIRMLAIEESVDAAVSKGDRLGTLTVTLDGEIVGTVAAVAPESIARLTFGKAFGRLMGSFRLF